MAQPTTLIACVRGLGGSVLLVGIVKRRYSYSPGGRVRLADEPAAIIERPIIDTDPHGLPRCVEDDIDVLPPKPATDVVVKGSAHARSPRPEWQAAVAVGTSVRILRVTGPRRAEVTRGVVRLPPPAPVDRVPLRWELAYGGADLHALVELTRPAKTTDFVRTARKEGIFAYPRNRIGRAYFIDVDRARADGAELPQTEDPSDPLTPERFFVPKPKAWIDAPLPGGFGWMPYSWYPRIVRLLGPVLAHDPPHRPVRETTLADGDDLVDLQFKGQSLPRAIQGAAPGLAVERLRGDETIVLRGLDRDLDDMRVELPGEIPGIEMRPPGVSHVFHPRPVLQTVRIDTDERSISLTWCGTVRLLAEMDQDQVAETSLTVKW